MIDEFMQTVETILLNQLHKKSSLMLANCFEKLCYIYPDPDNIDSTACFVVIDYNRPNLSISADNIVVPIYLNVGDMLKVAGDDNEVWFSHVVSVDNASRTCRVKFYVSDDTDPMKNRAEAIGS